MAEAESLQVSCPNCQKQFRVKRMLAGTRVRCPNQDCGCAIAVPEPKAQPRAEKRPPEPITQQEEATASWLTKPLPIRDRSPPAAPKKCIKPVPQAQVRAADFKGLYRRLLIVYVIVMSTQVVALFPQTETITTVEWVTMIPRMIVVLLLSGIFLHVAWAQIQDGQARTTPAKAVGYRFIPIFNFYWEFVAVKGLAEDIEQYARGRNIAVEPIPRSLTVSYCILAMVPPLAALIAGVCLANEPILAIQIANMLGLVLGILVAILLLLVLKNIAAASAAIADAQHDPRKHEEPPRLQG